LNSYLQSSPKRYHTITADTFLPDVQSSWNLLIWQLKMIKGNDKAIVIADRSWSWKNKINKEMFLPWVVNFCSETETSTHANLFEQKTDKINALIGIPYHGLTFQETRVVWAANHVRPNCG
jgi:hypothetical protein